MEAKISRGEAEEFINNQLNDYKTHKKAKYGKVHYGKFEIIDLLDKIYGPGTSEIEIIKHI